MGRGLYAWTVAPTEPSHSFDFEYPYWYDTDVPDIRVMSAIAGNSDHICST